MKTTIKTPNAIIEKLSKLNFVKRDGDKLISEEGFALSWNYKLHSTKFNPISLPPVQLLIQVWYNEAIIMTWGCSSNEDASEFVEFICIKKSVVRQLEHKIYDKVDNEGRELFSNL
jgi:hypothetical protein